MSDKLPRVPKGFRLAGLHCGIKSDEAKEDLTLVVCDHPTVAAGVYTQNKIFAAPVAIDRERTPMANLRAVVVNSGNANACTGQRGLDDANSMCQAAGDAAGAAAEEALVMSTGLIGEPLPIDKILTGIAAAGEKVAADDDSLLSAARGFMTTDTVPKLAGRSLSLDGTSVQLTGIAKGAAMIGPNMATMLGMIMTDAAIAPDASQAILSAAVAETFNCIRVEGHTSTNDTVLLLASGAAAGEESNSEALSGPALDEFGAAVTDICRELALAIVADGEGTTHVITVDVTGCESDESAREIALAVSDSPLVKTAIAGADPNWGRIVSAAGYAGVTFDTTQVALKLNGVSLYHAGEPVEFDAVAVSKSIRDERDVLVELSFGDGDGAARFWTTDLTTEYVRLNADYHT